MMGPQIYAASFIIDIIEAFGIPVVVAGLLGTGGIGALVPIYLAWKKEPVEKRDADLAAADAAQGMSLKLAEDLRKELDRMSTRISVLEDKLDKEAARRETLEVEVRAQKDLNYKLRVLLARAQDAIDYIVMHWATVRLKDEPPHFPALRIDE